MRLNLKSNLPRVVKYIQQRCKDYPVYVNAGPGKDDDEITLVTLGFQVEQAGRVALVFDTRPDAESDGTWQNYIEDNQQPFDEWTEAFDAIDDGQKVELIQADGRKATLAMEDDLEVLREQVGHLCRDALLQAKKKGCFKKLPLSLQVGLVVEDHDGGYGWTSGQDDGGQLSPEQVERALVRSTAKLKPAEQIDFWLAELDLLAAGLTTQASVAWDPARFVVEQLVKMGQPAIVPLLTLANRWAGKPAYASLKRGGRLEVKEASHQHAMCSIFMGLDAPKVASPAAEALIRQFIRTAIRAKPAKYEPDYLKKRTVIDLYGIAPWHAARLLHARYQGYPEAFADEDTNQLLDADKFTRD